MRLKYKISLVLIVITLTICLMMMQSYALWIVSLHGEENVVNVGCFQIDFQEIMETEDGVANEVASTENKSINLKNTYPISDEKGLKTTPYTFKITNTCSINSHYHVTLNVPDTNTLGDEYIKYAFYKDASEKPTTGSKLSEQKQNEEKSELVDTNLGFSKTNLKTSYLFTSGILKQDESVTYHLILWMDESADSNQMNKKFEASLNVINDATSLETLTEEQKQVFPNTTIDEVDESGNGLVTQTHDDYEGTENGWKTSELRYVGPNPNNYVKFNEEENTWRIIGLVNVKTTSGNVEQRVKIIRDSIGDYSWDSSESGVNGGYGVNEWSQADIMKLLNPGYDEEDSNNSLYWTGGTGTCYSGSSNSTTSCNFTDQGLSKSEDYISDDIVWNTGSNGSNDYTEHDYGLPKHFYEYERSSNNGKICVSDEEYCSDDVIRKTEWKTEGEKKALVGLMYPSDYGYATSGGTDRNSCLDTEMYNWNSNEDCYNNDWLFDENDYQWTMSPRALSSSAGIVFDVFYDGYVGNYRAGYSHAVRPVVYLNSNVEIYDGEGTKENNFKLRFV